ncbi:N-acetylmuramic acid 6-phosphate etherase [Cochlodiniinecator piscidefendens]|uniref:N-acetylmuramic acid 6-phosphate etherase n=1 Tax=Cochlodiniinecator piscidefendens TaxID=2715756 RepID=UPI00140872F9|nr:N-acetylmuramic acid 6-phosphate etherase [Cochlodiniinecator piscidefendens]
MSLPVTESVCDASAALDAQPTEKVAHLLLETQQTALSAINTALPNITKAAAIMAQTIRAGGRLIYAGAGSSGLMAMADALELAGTFGISTDQVKILMAGGFPTDSHMPGHTEDDAHAARADAGEIEARDTVIALSASGTTPYPTAILTAAKDAGASRIAIANNIGAPFFELADVAICLPTPPELIAGSTRMGAGSAQKVALNTMSTLMGVELGHVYDGMMVNLVADNLKLRNRAVGMVTQIANTDASTAIGHLETCNWAVKPAILMASGASHDTAFYLLSTTQGHLRAALEKL